MPSFALITEGITDQVVLERILEAYYRGNDEDELHVEHLQPLRDLTDQSRQQEDDFGGWQQVLEHCSIIDHIEGALATNDYIVIHVDADMAFDDSINFPASLAAVDVCREIEGIIASNIGADLIDRHRERFIFAVPVYSTECWLMSFYTKVDREKRKTNSCQKHLNNLLTAAKIEYEKSHRGYVLLTKPIKRPKDLRSAASFSESLDRFLNSLP